MSNNSTEKVNGSLEDKVDRLLVAVQSIDSRIANLDVRFDSTDSRLSILETRVDQRLRETQPIWEGVQAQSMEVQATLKVHSELLAQHSKILEQHSEMLQRLSDDMTALRGEVASLRADTEKGFRTIDRRMERQIGEFERLHAYQRDLEGRVDKTEKILNP